MKGIVYILTNAAFPEYIKIGKTGADLENRIKQLDQTNTPLPFECFYAAEVADCGAAEKLIHDAFSDVRVRKNREFFRINPERAVSALRLAALNEVTPKQELFETPEDSMAVEKTKERRARFNFSKIGIPTGTELHHIKDESQTCIVSDHNQVIYNGETMSLSQAALLVVNNLGYNWKAVSGPEYWVLDGQTLDEHRRMFDESE